MPPHPGGGQVSHLQWPCLPSLHPKVRLATKTLVMVHLCAHVLGLGAGAQFAWQVLLLGSLADC